MDELYPGKIMLSTSILPGLNKFCPVGHPSLERLHFGRGNGLDDLEQGLGVGAIGRIELAIAGLHFQLSDFFGQLAIALLQKLLFEVPGGIYDSDREETSASSAHQGRMKEARESLIPIVVTEFNLGVGL
jgi:hypothetical protein